MTLPADLPSESAIFTLEFLCDPNVDEPCPGGTAAHTIWEGTIGLEIVGCPTPSIASVTPSGWWAGESQDITITGSCFFTLTDTHGQSKVTVSGGTGSVKLSNVSVISSTQITATVNVEQYMYR